MFRFFLFGVGALVLLFGSFGFFFIFFRVCGVVGCALFGLVFFLFLSFLVFPPILITFRYWLELISSDLLSFFLMSGDGSN